MSKDNAAPVDVVVVEQVASATPIETRVAPDGVSPLLVKKGDRPSLVLKPKSERSKSSPKAVVTATVARKPTSQPVDLPINEGMHLQNFRLPPPLLTTPSLFSHC